ncbi:hypothetical protein AGMMS50249_4710 [candidate division SR1 bacterium]|nr:hypothetical protein AGMMS50249_4710 [candidate division SR1 bacterium]
MSASRFRREVSQYLHPYPEEQKKVDTAFDRLNKDHDKVIREMEKEAKRLEKKKK